MTQEERFQTFWKSYPRRVGRIAAQKAFTQAKVTDELLQVMLSALAWQRLQPQWLKDSGEYIPHPATWIRQGRYLDEPFEPMLMDDPWFDGKQPS